MTATKLASPPTTKLELVRRLVTAAVRDIQSGDRQFGVAAQRWLVSDAAAHTVGTLANDWFKQFMELREQWGYRYQIPGAPAPEPIPIRPERSAAVTSVLGPQLRPWERRCDGCRKPFVPYNSRHRFCTDTCRSKWKTAQFLARGTAVRP